MTDHLFPERSNRGFKHFPHVPSTYGGFIRVYESSAADGPHLWMLIQCPDNLNTPDPGTHEGVWHGTMDEARRFAEQILEACDRHYQNP